ncbi:hypothetical protein DV515_00000077 [Chloebia gouldiae]|uniref:TEX10-like TPR repeats domain-containing protein n=1 Tax=Chloebia gouldiae TaxID=44316 RepID=A0A3L8T149_CHLGU|nr:hypothetical protein DV515_00000077 [Chloebia gouldiae]
MQKFLLVSRYMTHHFFSLIFFCSCYSSNLCDLFHRLVQSSCLGRVSQLGAVIQQISSVQLYLLSGHHNCPWSDNALGLYTLASPEALVATLVICHSLSTIPSQSQCFDILQTGICKYLHLKKL